MALTHDSAVRSKAKSSRSELRVRLVMALLGVMLVVTAGQAAVRLQAGAPLRTLSFDIPFFFHSSGTPDDIRIVYLDELEGKDTLKRSVQVDLLNRLADAGAKAVIYDVVFDVPSPDPAVDEAFAAAIRKFRGVDAEGQPMAGVQQRKVFMAIGREEIKQSGAIGHRLIDPVEVLDDAIDGAGLVVFEHDRNFTVRELNGGTKSDPSMVWAAAKALGADLSEENRTDARWLNFVGRPPASKKDSVPILSLTARDVLDWTAPGFFSGKIVVIGGKPGIVGAALGEDLFSTPYHRFDLAKDMPLVSGVELQATSLANYLRGNWITAAGVKFDLVMVSVVGAVAALLLSWLRPAAGFLLAFSTTLIGIAAGVLMISYGNFWCLWSVPAFLQIPVAWSWGTGSHFYVERHFRLKLDEEQRRLHDAFSKYLSPQMLDRLIEEGFQPEPGGETVPATMLFTDLENFTDMCERVADPKKIVGTLNDYFERAVEHIFQHHGVVIKFIGDAIFAEWGAPVPDPDGPRRAVHAAWDLFQGIRLMVDGQEMVTRIGIHHGNVVAGNVGSHRRVDFTLIGDAVNLAARLESMNKALGTNILLSGELASQLGDTFRLRRVGNFKVKGRQSMTTAYELLGPAIQDSPPPWIAAYHDALAHLEKGDVSAATAGFDGVMAMRGGNDGPSRFFLKLIHAGGMLEDGICTLTDK